MSRLLHIFRLQRGAFSYCQTKSATNLLRAGQYTTVGVKRSPYLEFSTTTEFGPTEKPRRFGKDLNHENEFKPHPPPEFLKPGEQADEFEIICYKLHFIRIDNLGYRLKLAALYMQTTVGPNLQQEPDKNDHYEHAYWTAWKQLGNMSKEDSRREYIRVGNLRLQEPDPDPIIND